MRWSNDELFTRRRAGWQVLVLYSRVVWQIYPNLWVCVGFWTHFLWAFRPRKRSPETTRPRDILAFAGAVSNAIATIANGGKMPVLGKWAGSPWSVWRPARPADHVLILCDRFAGWSIGDMLIGVALILGIGLWLRKLWTNHVPQSSQGVCSKKDA